MFTGIVNLYTRAHYLVPRNRQKMSIITKFTKCVVYYRLLPESNELWQRTVCTSAERRKERRNESNAPNAEKNDTKQEFRTLRIMPPKKRSVKRGRDNFATGPIPNVKYSENFDWTNIWVGPKSFAPHMVHLPLRQGYVKKGAPPGKYGNAELMKIPNFLHLTPPAIKKHCDALQKFCTKWPENLVNEEDMEKHFPITVIVSDYCHSSPTIRDPLSRIVTLKIKIDALKLDEHARDKFLRLVGDRYDHKSGHLYLTAQNCPLKKQNYDHAMFILTALCLESWRVESWEKLKTIDDFAEYSFHLRKTKTNIESYFNYVGKPVPQLDEVAEILNKYIPDREEPQLITALKNEIIKLLDLPKFGYLNVDSAPINETNMISNGNNVSN